MTVLERIAFFRGRRDEVPNQELAKALAGSRDREGIGEIAQGLLHENQDVRSDCVKVLYEVGYIDPDLVSGYAEDFVKLLQSRNNRLIWGGMTALSTIAHLRADYLCERFEGIKAAMEAGSVITRDSGVRVLAAISRGSEACRDQAYSYLIKHLATCRPKDVPQHSESVLPAISFAVRDEFIGVLEARMAEMSPPQARRVRKVIQEAEGLSAGLLE